MVEDAGRAKRPVRRLFHASPSNADFIATHEAWRLGDSKYDQVANAASALIESFCDRHGITALLVSARGDGRMIEDGRFTVEHRRRRAIGSGIAYHAKQVADGVALLARARRFRPDVALIDVGWTQFFTLRLFRLAGIPVIPILHNTLWPAGFPPTRSMQRLWQALDRGFWASDPAAVIGVSRECLRQVEEMAPGASYPKLRSYPQFSADYFAAIPPPPVEGPFRMLFVGRATVGKGLLDLADMAAWVEERAPGRVAWTVCGDGPDLPKLRDAVAARDLSPLIEIAGWTAPAALAGQYGRAHAVIVPTRTSFAEGMAMTAIEAVCAGRPLVTNRVVPAAEDLAPACLMATPDDAASHAEQVLRLATDAALYRRLRGACAGLSQPFLDPGCGLDRVLERAFDEAGLTLD